MYDLEPMSGLSLALEVLPADSGLELALEKVRKIRVNQIR